MRRGRGRCNLYTANSDEFPTFEPGSYLSSRSRDCLLRGARRAVNYSERKASERARASAIDDSALGPFAHRADPQNERNRNKICPRLLTGCSSSSVSHRLRKRERENERKRKKQRETDKRLVEEDYSRHGSVGGAAFCSFLTAFLSVAFYPFISWYAIRKMTRRQNSILRICCFAPACSPNRGSLK